MGKSVKVKQKGRASLLLRLEPDVFGALRQLADKSGMSVNQLVSGMVRWGVVHGHPGRPRFGQGSEEMISTRRAPLMGTAPVAGCVWFSDIGRDDVEGFVRDDGGRTEFRDDNVLFMLDYSERRAVVHKPGEEKGGGR